MFWSVHALLYDVSLSSLDDVDINQCETNNGGCEQTCTNLVPGYHCGCYTGYSLAPDELTCISMSCVRAIIFNIVVELLLILA